jgi:hypothetical protein
MAALACKHAKGAASREAVLVDALENAEFYGGLTQALDEVEAFHPQAGARRAAARGLASRGRGRGALRGDAALLHGKAKEPFDDEQRPFCLRFATEDRELRELAFLTLCETIGVERAEVLTA